MYPSTKMTGLESLLGNFLVAHRLRLLPSLSRAHVQSLVGELRSCKPRGLKQKRACNHFCRKSQLSTRVTHILVMLGLDKWLSTPWSLSSSLWFSRKDKKYALNISNGELTVTHIHARMHTHTHTRARACMHLNQTLHGAILARCVMHSSIFYFNWKAIQIIPHKINFSKHSWVSI